MRVVLLLVPCVLSQALVSAAETVVFRDGVRMRVERHEADESGYWLYGSNGMITRAERSGIERIEVDGAPAAKPVPAGATTGGAVAGSPRDLINQAAARYGIDPRFLHAVAVQESGYRAGAVSRSGAVGVMQLMPATARHFGADPYDAAQNVDAGARYLLELLRRFRNHPDQVELALAAYNAGPTAVSQHGGIPPYRETRHYVREVLRRYDDALAGQH